MATIYTVAYTQRCYFYIFWGITGPVGGMHQLHFPRPTLLHVFNDSDFGRGAHGVYAIVGVASVGPFVRRFHIVKDKAAIWKHLDIVTIGTYRDAIPAKEQWEVRLKNEKQNQL